MKETKTGIGEVIDQQWACYDQETMIMMVAVQTTHTRLDGLVAFRLKAKLVEKQYSSSATLPNYHELLQSLMHRRLRRILMMHTSFSYRH